MTRNNKKDELVRFAELILSTNDYGKMKEIFSGYKAGIGNRPGSPKRIEAWKTLFELYK